MPWAIDRIGRAKTERDRRGGEAAQVTKNGRFWRGGRPSNEEREVLAGMPPKQRRTGGSGGDAA